MQGSSHQIADFEFWTKPYVAADSEFWTKAYVAGHVKALDKQPKNDPGIMILSCINS